MFKQVLLMEASHHPKELAPRERPEGKVQIREDVGVGAGGTRKSDPRLMEALGYEKHIHILFSVTGKARTHTSELETAKEKANWKGELETTKKA